MPLRAFPDFLVPAFDARALEQVDSTIVVIDPTARILWVNPAWDLFARENGGGRWFDSYESYLNGIAPPLRDFYRAVFANALATGDVFEQDYECSTAEKRRLFHLRALPIDQRGLLLEHSLRAEGEHDVAAEEAEEARYLSADGTISQCSNCRRVRLPNTRAWNWVPQWVARPHPRTSHVLCPTCVGFYWGRRRAT